MNIVEKFKDLMNLPGETEVVEWKKAENSFDFKELGKYFSALSNEANLKGMRESWLIFGVTNEKNILGTRYRNDRVSLDKLKHEISQSTTNGISFVEIFEIEIEGKRILLFQIPPAPRGIPIGWKGHYYARNGESLAPLGMEKFERIRSQASNEDWSMQICADATIDDLDPVALQKAREGFVRKHPDIREEEVMGWKDEIFLNKAKITIGGKITRAAILLLGKSESGHFISPSVAKISWILKDKDGLEKDYKHFSCPFIIAVEGVYEKIRNLRYRYIPNKSLFPDEIDAYDPGTIREAINNCIAHQDYELHGKINVVEYEDNRLVFSNVGSFIPITVENVIEADSPPEQYRNRFLADAMVNVNMIDTIGSGIKRMFVSQKNKFFPLPEYDLSNNNVKVSIIGRVLDMAYAKKLAQIPDLDLKTIIALDKVQKKQGLTEEENRHLREKRLIEGRKPNIYISSVIALETGSKVDYMKKRGIEDEYAQTMIVDCLRKFTVASREEIDEILLNKLPDILSSKQKKDKIKNLLQKLKNEGKIEPTEDRRWTLSK